MLKSAFIAIPLIFGLLAPTVSNACQNGDTSKVLLVVSETRDGEEMAVIGEIRTVDGAVSIIRDHYKETSNDGSVITLLRTTGEIYKFDRKNTREAGFCYQAILAQ